VQTWFALDKGGLKQDYISSIWAGCMYRMYQEAGIKKWNAKRVPLLLKKQNGRNAAMWIFHIIKINTVF
jgi:hypothetical protein